MRFTVFTLSLLAAATTSAFAAEAQPSAWLRVQTDVPYDGKAPLYFNFQPDEAVCKKQYGDVYQEYNSFLLYGFFSHQISQGMM